MDAVIIGLWIDCLGDEGTLTFATTNCYYPVPCRARASSLWTWLRARLHGTTRNHRSVKGIVDRALYVISFTTNMYHVNKWMDHLLTNFVMAEMAWPDTSFHTLSVMSWVEPRKDHGNHGFSHEDHGHHGFLHEGHGQHGFWPVRGWKLESQSGETIG